MRSSLFSEFSPTDKNAWTQQVLKDLKGKDFDTTLRWHTPEGFVVEPYYTDEDVPEAPVASMQAAQQKKVGWLTRPVVVYKNERVTNAEMLSLLQKGADALTLDLRGVSLETVDLMKLLNGLKLSDTPVFFQTNGRTAELVRGLQSFIAYQMKGGAADDGLAEWMTTGHLSETYFDELAALCTAVKDSPHFKTICAGSHVFHNAGANAAQELAFTLASAVTYVDKLTDAGLSAEEAFSKLYFSVSIGTNYFMEIAKLRALRYLWQRVQTSWGGEPKTVYLHAQTSTYYDAAITPNTNFLRATTESMSAVIGGCDALTVHAYDAVFRQPDEFSERIARNVSVLLKEEGHLDKTLDPAAGSYFLENLTQQVADSAWTLFLEVEAKGGLCAAFEQNFIQDQIEQNAQSTLSALQQGMRVMVGVNKFRVDEEPLKSIVEPKPVASAVPYRLLKNQRIAQTFEQ
ncbi:methylmalonyl-CoA mutase family protein [Runella slithyformis]|uniref:Methylmalonyl-CoA mutase n=1 Tax=Runella slithyformis (strain ATCC 29530 / DSM 19594 / LMG 11500 / NCIMB 11436 / LSU 4) TaxID=761193 RepID=A0A7U3ZRA9_RUNSL|nr:methylmalonyl-CoA mutase family protein [Runella slithyformis]AEI51936.1 Methylmalonyl-CoA mutase [Runella slithyformis DSM 19594]